MTAPDPKAPQFHLIMVKPSHYDDDGYVIQWVRSAVPSNTMAAIYGLAEDSIARETLGSDVTIELTALDETNTQIDLDRLADQICESGGHGLVALVGVQTNQFPRAVDLATGLIERGIQVAIGGFHVSGCVAMLPELTPELVDAMDRGITLFVGELEGRLDLLLHDAYAKQLKPFYDFSGDLPDLEDQPSPYLPANVIGRMTESRASFDAGRGCPFSCSFCTIINVQGRKSRHRSPDDVERIVRANIAQGITKIFITDDNFARNSAWEAIFDRLIVLRENEGIALKLTIQVDTLCHKIPRFIEKAGRAGVEKAFIGMESINPESLAAAQKTQNKITEYRTMLQLWHEADVVTLAGYILGFPCDTPESIARDIGVIQRELPIDILEFFILMPLPGSQDHKELYLAGAPLEADMNAYDSVHVCADHALMSKPEWEAAYHAAWHAYYTPAHAETVMRRAARWGTRAEKIKWIMMTFHASATIEKLHPLDGGLIRRKSRTDRRPGRPVENPFVFYTRYVLETLTKSARLLAMYWNYERGYRRAVHAATSVVPAASATAALDIAMQPVAGDDFQHLELFTATKAAQAVADRAALTAELRRPAA